MRTLIHKLKRFYININLATKALIFIGMISLIETVVAVFFDVQQTSPNDIAVRSVMSSVFGFIFGSQLSENSNIRNRDIQTQLALAVSLICLITVIFSHWFYADEDGAALVEIRNLLFSAVGFLLSRAKHPD